MAKILPPEDTRWKPGVSGNPGGQSKLSKDLLAVKPITPEEFKRICAKYLRLPTAELSILDLGNLPAIDAILVSAIGKATMDGDLVRVKVLLDRILGKVKEEDPEEKGAPFIVIRRANGESVVLGDTKSLAEEIDTAI